MKLAEGGSPPKDRTLGNGAASETPVAQATLTLIVSLKTQKLTLYSDGQPVTSTKVSTGKPGHETPTGVFSIIQKDRWHHSNVYDDAPMYYMQRLTWSGVALHQGVVPDYAASHGCVRLPEAFARQLWSTTRLGARVIIAHDDMVPVAISHPLLVTRKPEISAQPDVTLARLEGAASAAKVKTVEDAAVDPAILATVKIAENDIELAGGAAVADDLFEMPSRHRPANHFSPSAAPAGSLKPGPISVLISRKEGRLFVRKGFEPVFSAPVTFEPFSGTIGTHVFTALATKNDTDTVRWTVVSLPGRDNARSRTAPAALTAAEVLDGITMPTDAAERIASLLSPGASVIVTDQGLGPETGVGTDFIVLTH